MVQCAWCYGKLQGWEQGDNPLTEHARHFSSCPKFGDRKAVNASSLVNVHNTQGKLVYTETSFQMGDAINLIDLWPLPFHPGDAGTSELSEDDLGILTVRPCNPNFAVEASRLESYRGKWPSNVAQSPDLLSSAGFFYVGECCSNECSVLLVESFNWWYQIFFQKIISLHFLRLRWQCQMLLLRRRTLQLGIRRRTMDWARQVVPRLWLPKTSQGNDFHQES